MEKQRLWRLIVSNIIGWLVGEGFVHVKELTGLDPSTTYYYQVGNGIRRFEDIRKQRLLHTKAVTSD